MMKQDSSQSVDLRLENVLSAGDSVPLGSMGHECWRAVQKAAAGEVPDPSLPVCDVKIDRTAFAELLYDALRQFNGRSVDFVKVAESLLAAAHAPDDWHATCMPNWWFDSFLARPTS